jgi:hypothetical protein
MSDERDEERRAYREQRLRLLGDERWNGDRLGLLIDLIYLEVTGSAEWSPNPTDRDKMNLVIDRLWERWGFDWCEECWHRFDDEPYRP